MNARIKFETEYLKQLVGLQVDQIVYDPDNDFPLFGLKFQDGTFAWILCDPEGNGPGHLDIQLGTRP
jgi:ribosomal protein L2